MSEWTWEYERYDPAVERLRESLCTLGNGYFATRGAVPESRAGLVHYPATYAAQRPRPRLCPCAGQSGRGVDVLPGSPGTGRRRPPGRHDR
ncbi:hypothetical protein [Streptomyces dysideae]|uniref:hypothetical protein n=1 Tax=Streptomyces dysideae TaxID=909626 RepID=UPI000AF14830